MNEHRTGKYKYSFLNPVDEEKVLDDLGGKSFIKEKYPSVWAAVQRTKEYERELQMKQNSESEIRGRVIVSCPNLVGGEKKNGGSIKRLSSMLQMRLEDGTYIASGQKIEEGYSPESKTWPYAALSGTIRNLTDRINVVSYAEEFTDVNSVDQELCSEEIYSGINFAEKRVDTYCNYVGVDFNDVIHTEEYHVLNENYTDHKGDMLVSHFDAIKPNSIHGNNPIKMLYDREPSDSEKGIIDYSYKNVRSDNVVKTCIPIQARVQLKNGYVPAETNRAGERIDILNNDGFFTPGLIFGNPPTRNIDYNSDFNAIKTCFTPDANTLDIDFSKISADDCWDVKMDVNNYTTGSYEVGRDVYLHADFSVNIKNVSKNTNIAIGISIVSVSKESLPAGCSYYHTLNGLTVYIPPINIRWGCFAEGTRITMCDGSTKRVDDIMRGDVLFTTAGPSAVESVYRGPEKTLLCICTEKGKVLKLTHSHPVVLAGGGMVRARDIRPGQRVLSRTHGEDTVKWVFEIDYKGLVYNFEFTDGKEHIVEADGILAGEFIAQNSYKAPAPRTPHRTPQTQALVEELSALQRVKGKIK
ncbi:Hint domain-containing protein [Blautia schinkii]|nr:Hint domain-containing protein [Blautia schinkii]